MRGSRAAAPSPRRRWALPLFSPLVTPGLVEWWWQAGSDGPSTPSVRQRWPLVPPAGHPGIGTGGGAGPFLRVGKERGLPPPGLYSPTGKAPFAGQIPSLVKSVPSLVPLSRLPSGRVGPPVVALEGPAGVPQPMEAVPSRPVWKLWCPGGPGAVTPTRSSAPQLAPPLLDCQVPVPLLLSDGWENSREATAPSSLHR